VIGVTLTVTTVASLVKARGDKVVEPAEVRQG
jgi:hypothetical protein